MAVHSCARRGRAFLSCNIRYTVSGLLTHPDIYKIIPDKTVRSRMNICFRIEGGETAEEAFLKQGVALGLTGLRGHRDLRGIRASNYNSVSLEGAEKLANFIGSFASQRRNQ